MKLLPPARWEPSLKWILLPREAFPRSSCKIASPSSTDTLFSPCPLLIIWWSKSSSVQSPLQVWPCSRTTISTSSEERSPDVIIWSPLQIAISIGPPLLYRSKESIFCVNGIAQATIEFKFKLLSCVRALCLAWWFSFLWPIFKQEIAYCGVFWKLKITIID